MNVDRALVTAALRGELIERQWDDDTTVRAAELVVCTRGALTLHQEIDGAVRTVSLREGEAVVNPPGVWHTADCDAECTALFITAGEGTEHRPR